MQCFCFVFCLSNYKSLEALQCTRMEEGESHFSRQSFITFLMFYCGLNTAETWYTFKLPCTEVWRNDRREKITVSFWISNYITVLSECQITLGSLIFYYSFTQFWINSSLHRLYVKMIAFIYTCQFCHCPYSCSTCVLPNTILNVLGTSLRGIADYRKEMLV